MINVRQRMSDAFSQLPEQGGLKPNFKWGDEKHLNQLLQLYLKDGTKNVYPLIYDVSNRSTHNHNKTEAETRLSLILATQNTEADFINGQRWATSYENVLFPLLQNIEKLFLRAGIFRWDGEYELYEFPNYGEDDKNKTTDIWDALRIDTSIVITNDCLNKKIKF